MRIGKNRAFTLIELLAVIMIAGILAAIVVPQISPSGDLKVSAAARIIMSDINYAQAQAITSQKKVYVVFTSSSYSLQTRASDAAALAVMTNPISKQSYTVNFASGNLSDVSLASTSIASGSSLSFDETGTPMIYTTLTNTNSTLTSTATIRVLSGSNYMTIKVAPYTGEISLIEG